MDQPSAGGAPVLAADHPLAERPELTVEDLLGEPFGWIDDLDPVARDFWTLGDRREGRPPRIGAHITGFDDLFAAVRAGRVVAASPASVVTVLPFTDLVTRPVRDLEPAGFAVCRRADDPNPIAERFVRAAVALSRPARGGSPA